MVNIKLKTKGMHCPSCEVLVMDSLEELEGVSNAKADNSSGIVEVDFDESKTNVNKIKSIIKKEGYNIE